MKHLTIKGTCHVGGKAFKRYTLVHRVAVIITTLYPYKMPYVTVVTQARMVCLICTPEGGHIVALSGHIRQTTCACVQLLCNTSNSYNWLHCIYSSTYYFRLWVRIMTFILFFNTSTIVLMYQQREGTVFVGTNINYKLFTYCIKPLYSG